MAAKTEDERVIYIKSLLKKQPKIIYTKRVIPPFRAHTIPPFGIFIKKDFEGDNQILSHDLIHWYQYERMGLFMFYFRYLIQLIIIGYDTMPMEMEARKFDSEETKWSYRETYHKDNKN